MTINQIKDGSNLTIIPVGRLDSTTSDEFSDFINCSFTDEIEKLILDFTDVDFISSKGLRVLVTLHKSLNGRKLEIVCANSSVSEIFRLYGLSSIFDLK